MNNESRQIYTISQVNSATRLCLEEQFSSIWIEGEISNWAAPASGHRYFSLKDAQAQLRCALFSSINKKLNFKPNNGTHVIAYGRISLYEARGDYQFIVEAMEEVGDGKFRREFELLKKKLSEESLFDSQHKKPLPVLPKKIGIITSSRGAAIRDVLKILKQRFPSVPVVIYPTLVQGESAPDNIVRMIQLANLRQECDVLILTRGGGSLEDLWAFNSEFVARAIFSSKIPLISAIGHEIDFTIADFVADFRAPTPSAAAMCVVPDKNDWLSALEKINFRLLREMAIFLKEKKEYLHRLQLKLPHPLHALREQIQKIDYLENRFLQGMRMRLNYFSQQLTMAMQTLNNISPLSTLKRGYAIALKENGKIITHKNQVDLDEIIQIKFNDSKIDAKVI